jgi:hypothetical protein
MPNLSFDKKFGADFLGSVPREPGVYRYFDAADRLVYVGKAKNLRARLGQYRNASRKKVHRKLRRIVRESGSLEFEVTATEEDALLLENALIQTHTPPLNVEGAFSFLYPVIGVMRDERHLHVARSTHPELLVEHGFALHGCYRNRITTKLGFEAIVTLLEWVGHAESAPERLPYTAWRRFRRIPSELDASLAALLRGESHEFLAAVIVALLDKPVARRNTKLVQDCVESAKWFFDTEATRLKGLTDSAGLPYIAQEDRDSADIRAGFVDE